MNSKVERFLEQICREAGAAGIDKLGFHIETIHRQALEVSEHQVATTMLSDETLIAAEGCCAGKLGTVFNETLDEEDIPQLVDVLHQTARENQIPFLERQLRPQQGDQGGPQAPELSGEAAGLLAAEAEMYAAHGHVVHASLALTATRREVTLANQAGDRMTDRMTSVTFHADAMAKSGGFVQTAGSTRAAAHLPDYREGARRAALDSAAMLGASPCDGGDYPAVIRGDVFAALLDAYLPAFFAQNVQQGLSLLAAKNRAPLAAACFHLYEDPAGILHRTFDDEGAPTMKKSIIKNGGLSTLLYNSRSASQAGAATTGNGLRANYRSDITTAATNIHLACGQQDLGSLLSSMDRGVLITDCDGIFAGANPVSGDFSLISKGWLVEKGVLKQPVNQITIGGNFFALLERVAAVGSDACAWMSSPMAISSFTSPSVLVERLTVSS